MVPKMSVRYTIHVTHCQTLEGIAAAASLTAVEAVVVESNTPTPATPTHRLDAVADAHDELALLAHHVDEVVWVQVRVVALAEHPGGAVQRAAEPVTLPESTEVRTESSHSSQVTRGQGGAILITG